MRTDKQHTTMNAMDFPLAGFHSISALPAFRVGSTYDNTLKCVVVCRCPAGWQASVAPLSQSERPHGAPEEESVIGNDPQDIDPRGGGHQCG